MKKRIIFMGSPDFAVPTLRMLATHDDIAVVGVYTQPPKPKGRGYEIIPTPVHTLAESYGIPVFTPPSLKNETLESVDLVVVIAYGLLLPLHILQSPRLGCLNLHASLLPRWRGAAPLQRSLLAGDTQTGMTLMHMEQGLDTGPMLRQAVIPLDNTTTLTTLHDQMAILGAQLLHESLQDIWAQTIVPVTQPDGATYAPKIDKNEGLLDPTQSADRLHRKVRALNPWPKTWIMMDEKPLYVQHTIVNVPPPAADLTPGTFFTTPDHPLCVMCGCGQAVALERVQRPGGKSMPSSEFLKGCHVDLRFDLR